MSNSLINDWAILQPKDFPDLGENEIVVAWNCMEFLPEIEFDSKTYVRTRSASIPSKHASYLSVQVFKKK